MKRLIIILGLLGLLLDLGDDGFICPIKMVAPQSPSVSAQQQADDELSNTFHIKVAVVSPLPTYQADLWGDFHYRQVAVDISHPCAIVYSCHFCSSGGIPS